MRAQRAALAAKLDALQATDAQVEEALSAVEANVRAEEARLRSAQAAVDAATAAADQARRDEAAAVAALELNQRRSRDLAVNAYVQPQDNELTALMEAADLAEASRRQAFVRFSSQELADAFNRMEAAREDVGIARAAADRGLPSAISFTVETDGRLPSGDALGSAIEQVDEATAGAPTYYMINCAHPSHFKDALARGSAWLDRVRGIRANASRMSHTELDAATELDDGDPAELAAQYRQLRQRLGRFSVMGGCCGTDHRHIAAISEACLRS